MMSCASSICHYNRVLPSVGHNVTNGRNLPSLSRGSLRLSFGSNSSLRKSHHQNLGPWLVSNAHKRFSPVHAFGGEGKSENESFSWESLKKAMGGFRKEPSVGDFLKEVQQRGFDGSGGGRNSRGGGGGGDGDGESEDEGSIAGTLEETQEVILAVLGVVFLYIFMIHGEELWRLARDYILYLFGGKPSVRLRRAMNRWQKFYQSVVWKEVVREDWLERQIVLTETDWHKPQLLARLLASFSRGRRNQEA